MRAYSTRYLEVMVRTRKFSGTRGLERKGNKYLVVMLGGSSSHTILGMQVLESVSDKALSLLTGLGV